VDHCDFQDGCDGNFDIKGKADNITVTRCRNCLLHFLNCYWNSSVADYYVGPENASCYFEGCTFAGKANSAAKIWNVFNNTTNYCTFVNCTGNLPANSGTVAAPSYAYETVSAATAKNMIINSSCGAGATLTVTSTAEVSSSCDGEEPPVSDTEALTSIQNQSAARKVLRHGQVLILRDGKIYTVTGQSL
jgi:hypothetical protein